MMALTLPLSQGERELPQPAICSLSLWERAGVRAHLLMSTY